MWVAALAALACFAGGCAGPYGWGWGDAGPIHKAAWRGDVEAIRRADITREELHRGATMRRGSILSLCVDIWVSTPLELAIDKDRLGAVRALVEKGVDLNAPNQFKTPLEYAGARPDMVRLLLDLGADPNLKNRNGQAPIGAWLYPYATYPHFLDDEADRRLAGAMELLLGAGAEAAPKDGYQGRTPLHAVGSPRCAAALIKAGAAPDARDEEGCTPLMTVRNPQVWSVLVDAGADVNARDAVGMTPLMHHARAGGSSFGLLLELGADLKAVEAHGRTVLHFSAASGSELGVLDLLGRGVEVNAVDNVRGTALMLAAEKGAVRAVQLLLDAGADPMTVDLLDRTALDRARAWKPGYAGDVRDRSNTIALLEGAMAERKDGREAREGAGAR